MLVYQGSLVHIFFFCRYAIPTLNFKDKNDDPNLQNHPFIDIYNNMLTWIRNGTSYYGFLK